MAIALSHSSIETFKYKRSKFEGIAGKRQVLEPA